MTSPIHTFLINVFAGFPAWKFIRNDLSALVHRPAVSNHRSEL